MSSSSRKKKKPRPTGPYSRAADCECAIIFFVPEDGMGRRINKATGGYGYSHVAIDCCEIDDPTGKRTMIEATQDGVHRSFLDTYGSRRFARVQLSTKGADCGSFCECVKGKIGASYDILEAITKGLINSKKKEICSGLAAFCLPPDIKREISEQYNAGRLRKGSIRTKKNDPENPKFVSPNGLAEYFGAPPA